MIVVDTLRSQNLSLYGYDRDTSPSLAKFARDAVIYERAVTPGTWTVPAHASLLTGRWPSFHGAERVPGDRVLAMPINPEVPTLAEILSVHGYRCAGLVANSTYLSSLFGFQRGFQRYRDDFGFVRADEILRLATDWLSEGPGRAFLFVNLLDPHEPFEPPPPFDRRFPGHDPSFGTMLSKLAYEDHAKLTPEVIRHFISQYDGEVAYTDDALGRLFGRLHDLARYDESLIIVTSDHGEMFGEHGIAGHGVEPFEPLVHVPLLVKYPGNRDGGTRVRYRVSTLAVFATILDTIGIRPPDGMQASTLAQPHDVLIEDVDSAGRRVRVLYEEDKKLVVATTADGKTSSAIYDLSRDPAEQHPRRDGSGDVPLRERLTRFAAQPRPVSIAQKPVIDAEREAKLRALGYVR